MKNFYLFASIAGAVIPYIFLINFFGSEGLAPMTFLGAIFANDAAAGLTSDLLISSAVFWSYLISRREERTWLYVLLNLTIGLSCALPFYLYTKARQAEHQPVTIQENFDSRV